MIFELFFYPVTLLVERPSLAFIPAAVFICGYVLYRCWAIATGSPAHWTGSVVLVAGLTWMLYWLYESRMYEWSKTVVAPIRVDLLLIGPFLYLVTLLGIAAGVLTIMRSGIERFR